MLKIPWTSMTNGMVSCTIRVRRIFVPNFAMKILWLKSSPTNGVHTEVWMVGPTNTDYYYWPHLKRINTCMLYTRVDVRRCQKHSKRPKHVRCTTLNISPNVIYLIVREPFVSLAKWHRFFHLVRWVMWMCAVCNVHSSRRSMLYPADRL